MTSPLGLTAYDAYHGGTAILGSVVPKVENHVRQPFPSRLDEWRELSANQWFSSRDEPWILLWQRPTFEQGTGERGSPNRPYSAPKERDFGLSTDRLKHLVDLPLGSDVDLTEDEARSVALAAFGSRPDLPPTRELTRELRESLGHSSIDRLQKHNG